MDQKWKVLNGEKNWEDLLDPLDTDLRKNIIHYGEMAQATYDAFNTEKASKYAGSCHYAKADLFDMVGINKGKPAKYQVTKYIYATASSVLIPDAFILKSFSREAWSKESNWIGYVAVATEEGKSALGRRDIVIAWRGTIRNLEWLNDLQFALVPAPEIFGDSLLFPPLVHFGWRSIYVSDDPKSQFNTTSAREQVLTEVKRLVELYKDEEISITVTGHSLGAAIATLNAADIAINQYNKPVDMPDKSCPVTAFVFASPRVGDFSFRNKVSKLTEFHVLRIRNLLDVVPNYPLIGYADIGEEVSIDTTRSSYLKMGDIVGWHDLEVYMHGVAGVQQSKLKFNLEVDRDIALVNKGIDALKDEYCVPVAWWSRKHKGMVQQDDGTWVLDDSSVEF